MALLVMTGLGGLSIAAGSSAQAASARPSRVTKVAYGSSAEQWVHLTRPSASGRRPAVIFIHGGGWLGGGTSTWAAESAYWAAHGWVTINASYRLGSETTDTDESYAMGKQMLADMTSVLKLARSLPYVDRSRIIVVGDSAGGHLAAWMASRYYGAVAGMILWSPVAAPTVAETTGDSWDVDADCPTVCLQQRSLARRASRLFSWSATLPNPLAYLDRNGPVPTWVAGSTDEWVPYADNGRVLCAASASVCSQHLVDGDLHATKLRDANRPLLISARHWAAKTVGVKAF